MARKRHHKRKTHHRRRVSGFKLGGLKEAFMMTAGVAGGIIAGRMVNNMVNAPTAATPSISPTILGAGEAVVGGFASTKVKNTLIKGALMGFAGNGAMYALSSKGLNLLPATIGYGPDPMHRPSRAQLQGFRDVPRIGFPKTPAIGAGRDGARMRRQYAGVYG
jgi:hypothetical protein